MKRTITVVLEVPAEFEIQYDTNTLLPCKVIDKYEGDELDELRREIEATDDRAYQSGYNDGYQDGVEDGRDSAMDEIAELNSEEESE